MKKDFKTRRQEINETNCEKFTKPIKEIGIVFKHADIFRRKTELLQTIKPLVASVNHPDKQWHDTVEMLSILLTLACDTLAGTIEILDANDIISADYFNQSVDDAPFEHFHDFIAQNCSGKILALEIERMKRERENASVKP